MRKKLWLDGCDVKLNAEMNPDLTEDDLTYIPLTIKCDKVNYYDGDICILCGKEIHETTLTNTLMIRLYNPTRKMWCAYDVHNECFEDYGKVIHSVLKKFKKKRKEEINELLNTDNRYKKEFYKKRYGLGIFAKIKKYFDLNED